MDKEKYLAKNPENYTADDCLDLARKNFKKKCIKKANSILKKMRK